MGEVYRARDTRLDRIVAVKVVSPALSSDLALRARFEQEARAIAALNHPHICTIHDVGRHGDVEFLVMEFLEGETLAQRIRKAALPVADALALAIQIGDALDAAHRLGIVHRDLKPGNVMLVRGAGPGGVAAKLLDFGLAAPAATPSIDPALAATMAPSMAATRPTGSATVPGFSGTVQYMAPEQIEGHPVDHRADIFAFGCVLYEMLAGRKAFDGASAAAVIGAVMGTEPPPIDALRSAPPVLDHLLRRCLEKDRERRWQSVADVTGELRWIASQPLAVAPPAPAPVGTRQGWQRTILIGAGIAAAFVLSVLALVGGLPGRGVAVPDAHVLQFEVSTPPADTPGLALSPDGRVLAFVANQDRRPMLWLRSLDAIDSRQLPGTEGARLPFWSPDGRAIGFFAGEKLKRIDLASGAVLEIADAPNGRGATWGPDGTILFSPSVDSPIMRVSSGGGEAAAITTTVGRTGHRAPKFLEDGKRFLFHVGLGTPDVNGTYIGSLDGTAPVRVAGTQSAATFAPPGHLLTLQQGSLVAYPFGSGSRTVTGEPVVVARGLGAEDASGVNFTVSDTGVLAYRFGTGQRRQLAWVDRAGRVLSSLGEPGTDALASPELSPDERSVTLFINPRNNNEIGVLDLARQLPRLITNGPPADAHPLWDPDGRHVVYVSARLGGDGPVRQAVDGTGMPHPLFPGDIDGAAVSWTRDRQFVLLRRGGQRPDLVAVTVDGTRTVPVATSQFDETEGQFSPDGRWVAVVSYESGRAEVYVQRFPESGDRMQVSIGGGTQVRWSSDGSEIFYVARDGKMMAVKTSLAGAAPAVAAPVALFQTYLATGVNVVGSKPQYAVSRDGRFLLNTAVETPSPPIVVTVNWAAGLAGRR
jgi:Tol biopolymer transport system component